jgi:isopentenyldiphosphate isomerase
MSVEYFDVIDDDDNVVGRRPGSECVKRGLLHRAIAIVLFDESGDVYIQRRAGWMGWYPGHWTLSVMGHVSSGETYEQAAERELSEELGVACELRRIAKVKTPEWPYGQMVEREYLAIFEGRVKSSTISLSEETEEGRFVPFDELAEMAKKEPERLTPDTLLALEVYRKESSVAEATKERSFVRRPWSQRR